MKWVSRLPEAVRKHPLASFLKAAIKALVIVLLPWFLLSGISDFFASEAYLERLAQANEEMTAMLSMISSQSEPRQRFDAEFKSLVALSYPSDVFRRRLQQIATSYSQILDIYLFDGSGDCIVLPFLPVPPRAVARRFLDCVINPKLEAKYARFVEQFSGYRSAHKNLNQSPGEIIRIGSSHDRQWGGWFRLSGKDGTDMGHLIVFVKKSGIEGDEMLNNAVMQARYKFGRNYYFAWQDPVNSENLRPDASGFASDTPRILAELPWGERNFTIDGYHGIKMFTDSGLVIVAQTTQPLEKSQLFERAAFILKVILIVIFLILTPLMMGVTRLYPGLRIRIACLFLLGAGIPLTLLIFTGLADRSDQEKVLVDNWQKRGLEELNLIDEGMIGDYRQIEHRFKSHITRTSRLPEPEFSKQLAATGQLFDLKNIYQILLVRPDSAVSYNSENPGGKKSGERDSMMIYGQMLLEIINATYDEATRKTSTDLSSVINNMGGWMARALILSSGRVGVMNLLGSVMPTYADFFVDADNYARAMVFAFMPQSAMQRNYLFKISKRREAGMSPLQARFVALPVSASPFWPAFPKRVTAHEPELKKLADQVLKSGVPAHLVTEVRSKKYLLTAMRGSNLDGYILVMAQPYDVIARKIDVLQRNLQILAVLVVFLAFFSARVTSSLLLQPVSRLREALASMAAGNFRLQFSGATVSEFDAMLGSLNRTMSNLQELQVARSVQETLWPEEAINGTDWHLFGRCDTATELGGDHYDWLKLPDGRILLVIGDATGHGIAPAMVQASIKVWLALNAEKAQSAVSLLAEISRLHFNYGAKRLYMTCWLGFFDPATGHLEYASAGHPYPVIVRSDGSTEILKLAGMPLGIRQKATVSGDSRILEKGSSLILYTDGIIETTDANNQMLGFDGFAAICAGIAGMSAEAAVEKILARAAEWGPKNDDQSVIVLCRQPEAGEKQ